jgi:hypothetical protein
LITQIGWCSITATLMQLLARYGASELQAAILEALAATFPCASSRRRQERHEPPPIDVTLPEHVRAKDRPVTSHSLDTYDQLKETPDAD